jgi:cytochrome P450
MCAGDNILISLYSMGRMQAVWGDDCAAYWPERWLTEDGALRRQHVPAHKFLPFNAEPRSCLGKDVSVARMKCVVAAVVWNLDFMVLQGHAVEPKLSVVLQMKKGPMAKDKKRGIVVSAFRIITGVFANNWSVLVVIQ